MTFVNLCNSPMSTPEYWQQEIVKQVEKDFSAQAMTISESFKADALNALQNAMEGYAGTAIHKLLRETPRYAYIKAISAPDGKTYDAEIDLLFHTVDFIEI